MLRSNCLKAKQIRSILPIGHSCILCLAPLTPFTLFPSTELVSCFPDSSNFVDGPICLIVSSWQHETQSPFDKAPSFTECFCSLLVMTLFRWYALFTSNKLFIFGFLTYPIFSQNFILAPLLQPFWTGNTPDFASSFRCNRISLSWRRFPCDFGNRFDNFWMWSIFPLSTDNPNFWALEQALIQLWQPRLNTPFIYQFFNCRKGLIVQRLIFVDTSVRDILSLAQTPVGFNTTASAGYLLQQEISRPNSTLGSHPAPQLQLRETLPDGETDSITRVWPPRLLLRSQVGSKLG